MRISCLLRPICNLGNLDNTCHAYQSALALTSTADEHFEIAMKLASVYLEQENLVDALDTLEKIDFSQLSDRQIAHVWLLKAQILAAMNLPDQAVELLAARINTVEDDHIHSEMALQLAQCHKALENLTTARDILCQATASFRAGPGYYPAPV